MLNCICVTNSFNLSKIGTNCVDGIFKCSQNRFFFTINRLKGAIYRTYNLTINRFKRMFISLIGQSRQRKIQNLDMLTQKICQFIEP